MQTIYIIKYIAFYRNGDPFDYEVDIYADLYFKDYQTAVDFARQEGLKDFEIVSLNLYKKGDWFYERNWNYTRRYKN